MSTYFISDLHLQSNKPKIITIFINFLETHAVNADALYILGDLFETWVGDDDNSILAKTIKQALKKLTDQKIPVYFIRGNRDFMLGQQFAKETGLQILKDPSIVNLYGKHYLLMHGDLLCTDDKKYQSFRHKVYQPKWQQKMLRFPLFVRRLFAAWARYKSRKHTRTTDLSIQDVNQRTVVLYLCNHNAKVLIHGHTHRPATHSLTIDGEIYQRIVLSAWHEKGNVLAVNKYGKISDFDLT